MHANYHRERHWADALQASKETIVISGIKRTQASNSKSNLQIIMTEFLQKLGLDQDTLETIRPTSAKDANKDKHKSDEHYFICNFNSIYCVNIIKSRAKHLPKCIYFETSIPKKYQKKHKEFSKKR